MSECTGKVAYSSRRWARRARNRWSQRDQARHLRAYRCSTCGNWHLGTLPPAVLAGQLSAREVYQ